MAEPDDGERNCIDCGESFNLGEGGQDWNTTAGGPLCARCEDKWPTDQSDLRIVLDSVREHVGGVIHAWDERQVKAWDALNSEAES